MLLQAAALAALGADDAPAPPKPPLTGWLVAFALTRCYAIVKLLTPFVQIAWLSTRSIPTPGAPRWWQHPELGLLAGWIALEVVGLLLLLRRDRRAPAFWRVVLALRLVFSALDLWQAAGRWGHGMPWVLAWALAWDVVLPVLWLALWTRSALVGRVFGAGAGAGTATRSRSTPPGVAAQRGAPGRRGSALRAMGGAALALLWAVLCPFGLLLFVGGYLSPMAFVGYTVLALPLWLATWCWARGAGVALVPGRWLPVLWATLLAAQVALFFVPQGDDSVALLMRLQAYGQVAATFELVLVALAARALWRGLRARRGFSV